MIIYVPKRYDKIDIALAQFINEYPERDRIKIMFLRESEGVYQFGSKRVYIKIEQGDQPYVRVGGGYLHAREFIEYYTDQELEKLEGKNFISRFENKVNLQRIAQKMSTNSVERRPISRSNNRSISVNRSQDNLNRPLRSARLRDTS